MALGARPMQVLSNVVGSGLRMTVAGVALGLIAALALTRLLSSLLFGISPRDPGTFAGISAGLIVVAVLAMLLPARRAIKVDPLVTLRHE